MYIFGTCLNHSNLKATISRLYPFVTIYKRLLSVKFLPAYMEPKLCKPLNNRYQWNTPVTTNTEINTTGCVYIDVGGNAKTESTKINYKQLKT